MTLGELLARMETDGVIAGLLARIDDGVRLSRLEATARAAGVTPEDQARDAIARFIAGAGDEDWMGLLTAVGRAEDPGLACLRHMIDRALPSPDGAAGTREPITGK